MNASLDLSGNMKVRQERGGPKASIQNGGGKFWKAGEEEYLHSFAQSPLADASETGKRISVCSHK